MLTVVYFKGIILKWEIKSRIMQLGFFFFHLKKFKNVNLYYVTCFQFIEVLILFVENFGDCLI